MDCGCNTTTSDIGQVDSEWLVLDGTISEEISDCELSSDRSESTSLLAGYEECMVSSQVSEWVPPLQASTSPTLESAKKKEMYDSPTDDNLFQCTNRRVYLIS